MPGPRLVSLLPSATEILYAIGAGRLLVGRSHECDFPSAVRDLPAVTSSALVPGDPSRIDQQVRAQLATGASLYRLDADLLASLQPDIIITQDLCSVCSIDLDSVQRIAQTIPSRPRIVSLNPMTFEAVLDDHLKVGQAVSMEPQAEQTVVRLRERFYRAAEFVTPFLDGPNVAFLEWTDPLFIGGHWIPQLIERAGAQHPLNPTVPIQDAGAALGPVGETQRTAGKSVTVPPSVLAASRPDVVIVSPCGVTLAEALAQTERLAHESWWNSLPAVASNRIAVVDGAQMFSRPGPRLVDAFEFLVGYLNDRPQLIPHGFPWSPLR